jgi:hypothetical protein
MGDVKPAAQQELVRTQDCNSWIPRCVNSLLLSLSLSSLATGVVSVAEHEFDQAFIPLMVSAVSALGADHINQTSKSEVAISRMTEDTQARLIARQIQLKEQIQAADMGAMGNRKLTELGLDNAVTESEAAIYLAELEAKYADAVSRLQEFMEVEE